MSKLERLLNLTAVLLETRRPLSAEELRTQIEGYPPPGPSFRRTFERDKDDLRTLGIPLAVERVPGTDPPVDGYRIPPEEYYLTDPGLDPDELAALHLASLAVRLEGLDDAEAFWKLGGGATPDGAPTAPITEVPSDPALVPLFTAISGRQRVRFRYRDADRELDPWRLDFQRGRWYLTAFDHSRGEERNFRLDRIDGAVLIDGARGSASSEPPPASGARRHSWEYGEDEPITARLRVDAIRAPWARQQLGDDAVVESDDAATLFEVAVRNRDAFRSFVLDLLDHAELLSPQELRDDLVDWLDRVVSA